MNFLKIFEEKKGMLAIKRNKTITTKRLQPQTIIEATPHEEDPFIHLKDSKDADNIKRVVLEANTLDPAKYDLKQICLGITSNNMYYNFDIVMKITRL